MTNYKKYNELKIQQGKIDNEDFQVMIIDDVLLPEQIEHVYSIINNTDESQTTIKSFAGHKLWNVDLGNSIQERVSKIVTDNILQNVVLEKDYTFARYSKEFGYIPKLFPHFDTRESQTIVCDIQLNSTTKWGIVVEGKTYYLNFNQALIFSGTQQMHWREKKELNDLDKVDMIFCHLRYDPLKPLDVDQNKKLLERSWVLMEETGITNEDKRYE